jgi:PKD repeat protein
MRTRTPVSPFMRVSSLLVVIVIGFAMLAGGSLAAAGDIGYVGEHFSGTGTQVTGAKPESKLWWNDGTWWAVMWDEASQDNMIFRLQTSTHTWINTGVLVDSRSGTRADVLWDGARLYIASHGYSNSAQSGVAANLYRFSYDAATETYRRDAGFPTTINNYRTETLVIDKDSTGRVWATWVQEQAVYVNSTATDGKTWGTPFALPISGASGLSTDDISALIAFGGKVGVMWSNQNASAMYFAVHHDADARTLWRPTEAALSGPLMADDHINLKADGTGRVFAAVKTNVTDPDAGLVQLLVRDPATAQWSAHVFGRKSDHHTRPIVVLDEVAGTLHMFATSGEAGGTIYRKSASMDAVSFPAGNGTAFIRDASSADMNDATSTKQSVNATTGIVVLASNDSTGHFWHNEIATSNPPPLTADFTASPLSGEAPLTVTFTDASSGEPTSWSWDFGDGATSTAQNPAHAYSEPGEYSVTLTVSNGSNTSARTRSSYVTVGETLPLAADFTGGPLAGAAPLEVSFVDASAGSPTAWSWSFGDGSTSTAQNPAHTYTAAGTYSVTLTVTNAAGDTSTRTRSSYVSVAPPEPPVASFTASPTSGIVPLTVSFIDTSTGPPTAWTWDFGDGTAPSTTQHPSHTYMKAGVYTVTLTATSAGGSDTETRFGYINVTPPPTLNQFAPVADAWVSKTSPSSNHGGDTELRVKYGGDSPTSKHYNTLLRFDVSGLSGTIVSVKLRLFVVDPASNGGTVYSVSNAWTETGVTWANAPAADSGGLATVGATTTGVWKEIELPTSAVPGDGTYSLKIQAASSSDGTTRYSSREGLNAPQLIVGTVIPPAPPTASFTATPTSGAAPLDVAFTDESTGEPTSWTWGFGDGTTSTQQNPVHTYTSAGTYAVTLTATNAGGSHTISRTDYISVSPPPPPTASFTGTPTSGAAPLEVAFTDTSTGSPTGWTWDFGDGRTSTAQSPTHVFADAGTYTVTLTATNGGGSSTASHPAYVTVEPPPPPSASFTATPTSGIVPLQVAFTDTSTGSPTSWRWDFGDGSTSTEQHPAHLYPTAGTYTVALTVTNATASDSLAHTDFITVSPEPPPTASFTGTPTSGAAPLAVAFADTSTGDPTSWSWDFGDGSTSTEENPSHTYTAAGTYTVVLTVANAGGSDTRTRIDYITVLPPGSRIFGADADAYVNSATPASNFGTRTTLRVRNPGATGDWHTSYLRFSLTDLVTEVVEARLRLFVVDAGNNGGNVYTVIDNTWTETGITWDNAPPADTLLANTGPAPLGAWVDVDLPPETFAAGNRSYTLALRSDDPTDGTTFYSSREGESANAPQLIIHTATPVQPPTASFTGMPTSGEAPLPVGFTDTSTEEPTAWAWDFGDGSTSAEQHPTHTYATAGTYTVTLTATNAGGSHTVTRASYITVSPSLPPTASFTGTPTSGTAPLNVAFTDTSSGAAAWAWDFGDRTTSTEQHPTHTYTSAGSYTVVLTVTNDAGTDSATEPGFVTVDPPPATVSFSPEADSYVRSGAPTSNFGKAGTLRAKFGGTGETYRTYIRFSVSGLVHPVSSATLRLYVVDAASNGGNVYTVSDNAWGETSLVWNNAPLVSTLLANAGPAALNTWVDVTLPPEAFAAGDGVYTFAVQSDSATDGTVWYASRETTTVPMLVLTQAVP